jgi:hypothetical protein
MNAGEYRRGYKNGTSTETGNTYICSQLPLHPKEHPGINNIIFVPSYKENFSPKGCSVG